MVKLGKLFQRQPQARSSRQKVMQAHFDQSLNPAEETVTLQGYINDGSLSKALPLSVPFADCCYFEVADGLQDRGRVVLPGNMVADWKATFEQSFGLQLVEVPASHDIDSGLDPSNEIYVYKIDELESGGYRLLALFGPQAEELCARLAIGLDFAYGRVDITLVYPTA